MSQTVTPDVTVAQQLFATPGVTKKPKRSGILGGMGARTFQKTYIKEWRQRRGLSLRALANRMETEPGGELLISHVSLGRIENGEQPYSQPILEALAVALDCTKSELLEVNPQKDGEIVDLLRHLNDRQREEALRYLRFLAAS